jgi:hypothetical protein
MSEGYLERKGYGTRWAVESFFNGLKWTTGSTLTSRKPSQLLAEAAFKVLAYIPPTLAEPMQSLMFSTEQSEVQRL